MEAFFFNPKHMFRFILLYCLIALPTALFSQNNWCGTDKIQHDLELANPQFKETMHKSMLKAATGWINQTGAHEKVALDIPVVVHIIHDNGIGKISDEQVNDALRILNQDYNRLNPDTIQTRNTTNAPFKAQAGVMDVHFKLAKLDPNGNCTNGIIRVNAPSLTYNANDDCKYTMNGGSDQWPMDQYLNIWVVNSIENSGAGTILGYAYLPYWPNGANYGILIRHDAFGTIQTAANADGRTLTHEMGHLLGLQHIFDAGWNGTSGCHTADCNSNGDYCCDTPPQAAANWSCSQTWNSCNDVPLNDTYGYDVVDQIENYMSYNECQNMFSMDQAAIMQQNFIDITFLANMVTQQNITATGINAPAVLCFADFEADQFQICTGDSIRFSDLSYHNPNSWNWSVSPGTANLDWAYIGGTTATSQDPKIQFFTQGKYQISLAVTDGITNLNEVKSQYITVLPSPQSLPFYEGFEDISVLSNEANWIIGNYQTNAAFEIATNAGHTGTRSAKLMNFNQSELSTDELSSSAIDLSNLAVTDDVTLSFRYAYRKKNAANEEWLRIFVSDNCGDSWDQRKSIHGNNLSDLVSSTSWTPSSSSDWTTVHVTNITSSNFVENFRFKFEFKSDYGNNFYLDDINLYAGQPSEEIVLGLPENEEISNLQLYPNPSNGEATLLFELSNTANSRIEIQAIDGTLVQSHTVSSAMGKNMVLLSTENLSKGMYFLRLTNGKSQIVLPWIIE